MLPRFFSEIFGGVWLMDKSTADSYMPLVVSILKGEFQKNGIDFSEARQKNNVRYITTNGTLYTISDYGSAVPPEKAPKNSIAVINVTDVISKYDMECGPAGMKTKGNLMQRCYAEDNIRGIILNIDSGGGEGGAMRYFNGIVEQRNKPVISFVDDFAASAGYGIAASTDWIVANNNLAKVGSIGTYMTIADYAEFWKMEGIRLIEVYADKSKDKNKEYYDAIKGDTSGIKEMANRYNEEFLASIKNYRGSKLNEESVWGTGKLFDADKVVGTLVDEIASWEETVYSFANSLNLA